MLEVKSDPLVSILLTEIEESLKVFETALLQNYNNSSQP